MVKWSISVTSSNTAKKSTSKYYSCYISMLRKYYRGLIKGQGLLKYFKIPYSYKRSYSKWTKIFPSDKIFFDFFTCTCSLKYFQFVQTQWNDNYSDLMINVSLRKKYPYSKFFWSVFSRIRTEYGPEKHRIRTLFTPCVFRGQRCELRSLDVITYRCD